MEVTLGILGIGLALAFMTFAVYKNWSILYCSVISIVIIALTNRLDLVEVFTETYVSGLGDFAAPNLLLFVEGAMIGKLFDDSGAAWRLGSTVVSKMGKRWSLIGYILVASILEWGGISTFVICFVLLPLSKPIFKETNTPWYLWPAITLIGIIPPELIWPGGLQIHNILPTQVLGTTLMAAPVMSIVMAVGFYIYSGIYITIELKRSKKVEWKRNSLPPSDKETENASFEETAPNVVISLIPIVVCLVSINVFDLEPVFGLGFGVITAAILFYRSIDHMVDCLNMGAENGIKPLILVAAVVGIAQVVASTASFDVIRESLLSFSSTSKLATGAAVVGTTNIIALICGSASGAITMILNMFSEAWMAAGLTPEWIHRTVCVAAGGLDTVPWNSFVVMQLSIAGLTHKKAYMPMFFISLLGPILTAMLSIFFV